MSGTFDLPDGEFFDDGRDAVRALLVDGHLALAAGEVWDGRAPMDAAPVAGGGGGGARAASGRDDSSTGSLWALVTPVPRVMALRTGMQMERLIVPLMACPLPAGQ